MKFHKQLFKHQPEIGIYGDCHRTAIACLLDLEPLDVPHFGEHFLDVTKFNDAVKDYLASQGLAIFSLAFAGGVSLDQVLQFVAVHNPETYYLVGGTSPRGFNHTVIAKGGELIHDPHPDNTFLVAPCEAGTENAAYWIDLLIPIRLTKAIDMTVNIPQDATK